MAATLNIQPENGPRAGFKGQIDLNRLPAPNQRENGHHLAG